MVDTPPATRTEAPPATQSFSTAYRRYALGLLCVVYVVNFVDRQVLSILLQSIKEDLGLSDTELGLLSGTAFGIFYATLGIPIARLADVFSRKWVITAALSLWSAATALCGTATSFVTLLGYRIAVGVGEAGGSPPSHSLISDYFPAERRGTALGIFSLGVPLGILIGLMAGGWLDETLGWRAAFLVVGLPGLVLAVVVATTLREPPRGMADGVETTEGGYPALEVIRFLWKQKSFRYTALASGCYAFVGYSTVTWTPAFLERTHQMESGPIGTWLGLILGLGGAVGVYAGGALSDRWARSNARGRVYIPALAVGASLPLSVPVYLAASPETSLAWLILPATLGMMYQGPSFAITQALATPKMRATAAALLLFIINIIGLACGPFLTGMLSDALEPTFAIDSLRIALLLISTVFALSALLFWWAARTLEEDLATSQQAAQREAQGLPLFDKP